MVENYGIRCVKEQYVGLFCIAGAYRKGRRSLFGVAAGITVGRKSSVGLRSKKGKSVAIVHFGAYSFGQSYSRRNT